MYIQFMNLASSCAKLSTIIINSSGMAGRSQLPEVTCPYVLPSILYFNIDKEVIWSYVVKDKNNNNVKTYPESFTAYPGHNTVIISCDPEQSVHVFNYGDLDS